MNITRFLKRDSTIPSGGLFTPQILQELDQDPLQQNDERAHRDTLQYGYSFVKAQKGDFSWTPIPEFLTELGQVLCRAFDHPPSAFNNVMISIYDEGFFLATHVDTNLVDHPHRPYYFGERVYGIIIEQDPTGHLYFVEYRDGMTPPTGLEPIYEIDEQPGTIFCLEGPWRNAPYFHGVSKVSNRRLSITFRTVIPKVETAKIDS